jgi:hypothetical protein
LAIIESKGKPLATWLMENIVKGDGSEYLDFEEISSKLTSILPKKSSIIESKAPGRENFADCAKDDRFVYSFCRHRDE